MKINAAIVAITFLAIIASTVVLYANGKATLALAIDVGFLTSFVYIIIGFVSISKSFGKSTTAFYRFFFGGLAIRFILFLATLLILFKYSTISIAVFGLSFIFFYVIFQTLEIRFIWQKLENQKSQ